jgi:predicted permease
MLRHATRTLARAPGFSAVVIATLAIGIGGSTAAFTFVNAVLLAPLPFADSDRLVVIRPSTGARVSAAYLHDWREGRQALRDMAGWFDVRVTLTGRGEPLEVAADRATTNFFDVLGVPPLAGRTFTTEPSLARTRPEVVLSHGFWQREFGGRPDAVGESLTLNGEPFTIVGVLPERFAIRTNELPESRAELWIPMPLEPGNRAGMGGHLNVVARLAPGATTGEAEAELAVVSARIEEQYPSYSRTWRAQAVPLYEATVRDVRLRLVVIFGAVGVLLLIACANVAHLVSSRGVVRQTELAVRLSLGATPRRLLGQLMGENLLLAVAGGALGLLLALWLTALLASVLPGALVLPRGRQAGIDLRVLAFGGAATALTTLLFGLIPAWTAARSAPRAALQAGRGAVSGFQDRRLNDLLIVSEIALAMLLLTGAGLVGRSLQALTRVDPGFRPESALTLRTSLSDARYDDTARVRAFGRDVVDRVARLPGVAAVGSANYLPLSRIGAGGPFVIESRPTPAPGEAPGSWMTIVGGRYFDAMGIPVLRGRVFSETDTENALPVFVIDETLARRYWPDGDAVGARLTWREDDDTATTGEVVGVVKSVRYTGLSNDPQGTTYFWFPQRPEREMSLIVRTAGDPLAVAGAVRAEVHAIDAQQPVSDMRPLASLVAGDLSQPRVTTMLLGGFAAVALALAALGLYAMLAFGVARRTREIGVRMALGAAPGDVTSLVVRRGVGLVAIGLVLGTAAALAAGRVGSSLLFGVTPADPVTLTAGAVLLALAAALATAIPARRATRVDPVVALRTE